MFPIKYMENNLVWNQDGEVYAYYELIPYNYSFLSAEQKFLVHDSFRQLIAQNRDGKIHALQIATESSVRLVQEQSKKQVTGRLRDIACNKIDEQTEALVSMIGDNQIDYRFFLGFKLLVTEQEVSLKNVRKSASMTFADFIHEVSHKWMGDFVSMGNDEINRYTKMEKLLENKISRRFKIRRLDKNDFGYLIEHVHGKDGIAYEDYDYPLPKKKLKKETLLKRYDLIKPTRCLIEEKQRYLRIEHEDSESYVAYFTINSIVGELDFPSSEIFYYQQKQFSFPIETSMNVEIVTNKKALSTVRNKKKELKDLDNHAWQAGSETGSNVMDALDSVNELETSLDQSKESMYKLSYVIRVSAPSLDELKRRTDEVMDFYDDVNVKLVRPFGYMLGLHGEFIPPSKRYINDYIQNVTSDFLAGLGFGATQVLGEANGIYMGNPLIGDWKLREVTTKRLSQYYNDLLSVPEVPPANRNATGRCVQPANIKKIHDIIRCALNQAIRWEYLDTRMRNPASLATLPKIPKVRRKVWSAQTFKNAVEIADDEILLACMHLAFSCSLRIGEITGLTWEDVIIDEESIADNNARVIVNKELSRISVTAMQKLKEKDVLKIFPSQKPHCATRLVLKTPKTETSNRTVWLPKTVALKLVQYKKDQQELQEFLGCDYHDYNLVVALENGNPVEGKIVRDRFTALCKNNGFEVVVFHSLRHLSTGYKLKLTNGDMKSVQGDTGQAEAEMVTDVYSEIIDEDRRLNAQKMDEQFYGVANVEEKEQTLQNDIFLGNLIDFLKDKENRAQLQALLNQVKD